MALLDLQLACGVPIYRDPEWIYSLDVWSEGELSGETRPAKAYRFPCRAYRHGRHQRLLLQNRWLCMSGHTL